MKKQVEYKKSKDRSVKESLAINGFEKINNKKEVIFSEFYNPDILFVNDKKIIVVESSSTGDRKVHIGELFQFLVFAVNNAKYEEFYFLLDLCGQGKNRSTSENEIKRLQYYFNNFPISQDNKLKIKKIAICDNFLETSQNKIINLDDIVNLKGLL